jgi:hypothetical protein
MRTCSPLLLLIAAACATEDRQPVTVYMLPPVAAPAGSPTGPSLLLARVEAARHVDGIAIRRPDHRLDTLVYSRLAAPWPELLAPRVRAALMATGAFGAVLSEREPLRGGAGLTVWIDRAEIVERGDGNPLALVGGEVVLWNDGVFQASSPFEGRAAVEAGGPPGLVDALARAADAAALSLAEAARKAWGTGARTPIPR